MAYKTEMVGYGQSCESVKEERFCNNGVLSGSYTKSNCSDETMKVFLWNLARDGWEPSGWPSWGERGGRKDKIVKIIKEKNTDVLLFQEVTSGMYSDLKQKLSEYPYSHYVKSGNSDSSNVIFSKFPMKNKGWFYVHQGTGRTCPYATINGIRVFSCHMPPPGASDDLERQQRELPRRIEGMRNIVSATKGKDKIILGGDFNTQRHPYDLLIYETLRQNYSSCGRTVNSGKRGVDFVFSSHVCDTDEVLSNVIKDKISDHYGFVISIDFGDKFTGATPGKRDMIRLSHLKQIRNALKKHYAKYGSYTQPEAGASDCSTGRFSENKYCCNGSDCKQDWGTRSNLQVLVEDGFLNKVPVDPINNQDYNYRYEPLNEGQSGGTHHGWGYDLCVSNFETHIYDTSTRDYTKENFCYRRSYGK